MSQWITYAKLSDDSWGVRVEGDEIPSEGELITVEQRNGNRRDETVQEVIWSGEERGVQVTICSIERQDHGNRGGRGRGRGNRGSRDRGGQGQAPSREGHQDQRPRASGPSMDDLADQFVAAMFRALERATRPAPQPAAPEPAPRSSANEKLVAELVARFAPAAAASRMPAPPKLIDVRSGETEEQALARSNGS